jgi:cystathionine beta-lyase
MLKLTQSQATYLMWIDCSAVTDDTDALTAAIRERTGLYLSAGAQFGGNGRQFVRMNIACPRSVLMDGLGRLKRALD